ncbi:MAG: putative D,D-dipeptide transport system permease protein DdpC [Paracidovorax wautersii]|uniref:Putative D,D-dipeptide transport system permease protein DdpC n=1 Tax=Paracidovorax wautersii TaxID=1177982 RepID=A0A7V8JP83_9BURK|nr:MAG: putative D,D-dipeptide transport system permease protein DdpC [Paracidovorax wautersii]
MSALSSIPRAGTQPPPARTRAWRTLRALRAQPVTLWLAWAVITLAALWALAPTLFTQVNPVQGLAGQQLQAPGAAHWLGTDALGRDVYARLVHGAVHSLSGAFVAVAVGLVLGTLLGLVTGAVGGFVDDALMRLVDVLLSVPALLLSLAIIIILGFGTINAAIAVGVASVASFARLVRSEVVRVRRSEYVEAAFGSGGRFGPVLWRHVLPNSLTSVIGLAALQFGSAILSISTLGFLGYGAPPPTPEWGLLIAEGRNYLATAWWLTTVPGVMVVLVVLSANRISAAIGQGQQRP